MKRLSEKQISMLRSEFKQIYDENVTYWSDSIFGISEREFKKKKPFYRLWNQLISKYNLSWLHGLSKKDKYFEIANLIE